MCIYTYAHHYMSDYFTKKIKMLYDIITSEETDLGKTRVCKCIRIGLGKVR